MRPGRTRTDRSMLSLALCVAVALLSTAAAARAAIGLGSDPRIDPARFEITVFASGLPYPTSLQPLEDGSLLVLTNVPTSGLFDSTGELVRLVDADQDGVADAAPQVLFTGLPGVATSVRKLGDLVFVSSRALDDEKITVLRTGALPGDPYTQLGTLDFVFPSPAIIQNHRNVALAVRAHAGPGGDVEVFFNVGSDANSVATTTTFEGAGLLAGVTGADAMNADSIYRATLDDSGPSPTISELTRVATGLRNAAGIAFHPVTGDLYFEDNGIDPSPPVVQSADELNVIASADVGGAIEDFGFPTDYVEYQTGVIATGLSVQPRVVFQPVPDPSTGDRSEGPVEIAFAPPAFPPPLRDGVFVGFHGLFSAAGASNAENPVVFVDLRTLDHFHFVPVSEPSLGHPNGLLATKDSLFVVDLTSNGSIFGNSAAGAIHQIRALPASVPGLAPVARGVVVLALVVLGGVLWKPRTRTH